MNRKYLGIVALVALCFVPAVRAEEKQPAIERLRPEGINGTLVVCGKDIPDAARDRFLELAGKEKAQIVFVISSKMADRATAEKLSEMWKSKNAASMWIVASDSENDDTTKLLRKATGVWILDTYPLVPGIEKELQALLQRGGILGTSGKSGGNVPGAFVQPFFKKGDYLGTLPRLFSIGIGEGAALVIRGRQMNVLGDGTVTIALAKSATHPQRTIELTSKSSSDLTMLRRAAVARDDDNFPPKVAPVPEVPKGSLVIVGGGGMPADVTKKFIELAGGPDALIVVLPTANPDPLPMGGANEGAFFKKAGAKNVVTISARKLEEVNDPKNLELINKAGGVWFGGGRQWRFVDAYEGTKMEPAFHEVLKRGGVIGGSSAGASIQGYYMCRGSPLGNLDIMCEGYERGLGFLPGVAIDQHFTQRKRFPDMAALVKTYPQLLGIGLDEATAIVVHGHVADVMGKGEAHFFDRTKPMEKDAPDHESIKAGGRYDLKDRKTLPAERK